MSPENWSSFLRGENLWQYWEFILSTKIHWPQQCARQCTRCYTEPRRPRETRQGTYGQWNNEYQLSHFRVINFRMINARMEVSCRHFGSSRQGTTSGRGDPQGFQRNWWGWSWKMDVISNELAVCLMERQPLLAKASSIGQVTGRTRIWRVMELMNHVEKFDLSFRTYKAIESKAFKEGIAWKHMYLNHVIDELEKAETEVSWRVQKGTLEKWLSMGALPPEGCSGYFWDVFIGRHTAIQLTGANNAMFTAMGSMKKSPESRNQPLTRMDNRFRQGYQDD